MEFIKMRQVLCHICCAEFDTTKLELHRKTCREKHRWGLDVVLHEENISKKQAAVNRKKCCEPGEGTSLPLPTVKCKAKDFDDYNSDVLAIFSAHSEQCLYCRERNQEAIENALHAREAAKRKEHADDEGNEDHRLTDDERLRHEEERLKHALEEEAHRLAEEEAERRHEEDVFALKRAHDLRSQARALVAEHENRSHAVMENNLQCLKEKMENAAHHPHISDQHRREEESLLVRKKRREESERRRAAEEREDNRMIQLLREEEAARRKAAEERARTRRLKDGHHHFLKKHEGALASSQGGLVYEDMKADEHAVDDIKHMSLAHARQEHLIHEHHTIGGKSFHDSMNVNR